MARSKGHEKIWSLGKQGNEYIFRVDLFNDIYTISMHINNNIHVYKNLKSICISFSSTEIPATFKSSIP